MRNGISQEGLKAFACITMLIDHLGATLILDAYFAGQMSYAVYEWMRCIGRLAFPIFAFLLAEGAHYTRNPVKYALRLLGAAVLSELPFDLAFHGSIYWASQNVMLTLLLGLGALEMMKRCPNALSKVLAVGAFSVAAELLHTDYGAHGVVLIAMFGLTRGLPYRRLIQGAAMALLFTQMSGVRLRWTDLVTMQQLATLAIIPISLYSGKKKAAGLRISRRAFYLFYPVHIAILWLLGLIL